MEADGKTIPETITEKTYSGKFLVRISPKLYRQWVRDAMEKKIGLSRYITSLSQP